MKKTLAKIILGITIFLGAIICSQNVSKASNLDLFKGQYSENEIFEISPNSNYDLADEIRKVSRGIDGKLLIHIPSGTYTINNTAIFSNTAIVAENDTIIKSTENAERIIRIADSENILIYGGIWNADFKSQNCIEFNNVKNLKIENVTVQNATKYGMVFYNGTNASINNVKVKNNKDYGVYSQNSIITVQNSEITYNDCSGIAATGATAKIYVRNNKVNNNEQNPRGTDEGQTRHGVAVQEGAYGEISNNTINNNKVCGISVSSGNATAVISNNQIYNNVRHGIGARIQTNMTVTDNNIYGNSYNGIMVADRSNATLKNNTIRENACFGLSVGKTTTANSEGNNISDNKDSNITVNSESSVLNITNNNTINNSKGNNGINVTGSATLNITGSNNVISGNSHHGISVTSKDVKVNLTGNGNTIKNNKGAGVYVEKSQNIKLSGKTTIKSNKTSGVIIYGAKVTAKNLTIKSNSQYGVAVRQKGNLTITKSTVKSNKDYGIHVVDKGTNAKIENNTISYNKNVGINVDKKAKVSSIYKNELKKNGDKAIRICNSAEVKKIKKNNIKKHSKYGIYIKKAKAKTITGNKFSSIKKKYQIYKA